jgi:hypothetical protein
MIFASVLNSSRNSTPESGAEFEESEAGVEDDRGLANAALVVKERDYVQRSSWWPACPRHSKSLPQTICVDEASDLSR